MAAKMGITPDSVVLDVGCGVGGPAREICRFTDANIVGLNNNDYQIARGTEYAAQAGLSHKLVSFPREQSEERRLTGDRNS